MSTVTITLDNDLKRSAVDVSRALGFELTTVTRAFYRQIVRERRIPLTLDLSITAPGAAGVDPSAPAR
jgi:DNA-damage-inducible protein J